MRRILIALGCATLMAGCGDPLRDVPRLGDVAVADAASNVTERQSEARAPRGGLFGRLLNRAPDDPTNAAIDAALADADVTVNGEPATADDVVVVAAPAPPETGGGLFGLFRRSPGNSAPRTGVDASDVGPGVVLPFGEIARVCGVRGADLGRRIDSASGYDIYDTIPNSTAPRPFYITGFDDNCARTFTGAVVISGDVETHEFVRYRPSNRQIAYTQTDNAYEALKAGVCRVGQGEPCGARTDRLNQNTRFITVYNFFGGTFSAVPTKWAQILLHDGEVVSMSIKDGQ